MAYIKGEDRYQITMFPESIDEYIAYFGDIRTMIPELSGQHIGIIRTPYRNYPDTVSELSGHLVELTN